MKEQVNSNGMKERWDRSPKDST